MPILNEAGIPQISPGEHGRRPDVGRAGRRAGRARQVLPDRQRAPTRASCRKDTIQGAALATIMKEDGCKNVAHGQRQGGLRRRPVAQHRESARRRRALKIAFNEGIDPKAPNYRSLASRAKSEDADCFVFSGITANNGVQIFKDVAAALPDAKLYGPDGVAEAAFSNPKEGGIPAAVGARRSR